MCGSTTGKDDWCVIFDYSAPRSSCFIYEGMNVVCLCGWFVVNVLYVKMWTVWYVSLFFLVVCINFLFAYSSIQTKHSSFSVVFLYAYAVRTFSHAFITGSSRNHNQRLLNLKCSLKTQASKVSKMSKEHAHIFTFVHSRDARSLPRAWRTALRAFPHRRLIMCVCI